MQQLKQPLVSVIIPCYNHEQFIQDCIKSIINQTYKNIELIIIDDGSKDSSVTKIQEMITLCEKRFTRFELRSRTNKGLSKTLNEAIKWSKGEYWTPCASDDFFHKNKVSAQVEFFLENRNCKFCITKSYVVSDVNEILSKQTECYNLGLDKKITFDDILTFKVHLPVSGMYNTHFIRNNIGYFDADLAAEDYDLNLKLFSQADVGIVPKKLYYYRSPAALGTNRVRMPMRVDVSESHLKTIKKYKNHPEYKNALVEWNFRRFIYYSAYKNTKLYSFKGMIKSYKKINNILYLKALFRLIFYWRKA